MKKLLAFLVFSLTVITNMCIAQQVNSKIDYIAFKLIHSKRIPNQSVIIKINNEPTECLLHVSSIPKNNDKKWEKTFIDTTFVIDKKVFINLANEVLTLNEIDLNKAFTKPGLDGTTCTIEFGTNGNVVAYKFWTPDSSTEFRGLSNYLELCKKIIKIGGLNVDEIL